MPAFEGLFRRFPNCLFIETGTFRGYGVEEAIWAGFSLIISIERAEHLYEYCKDRFKQFPNVHILLGNSGDLLSGIMDCNDFQTTFWLDAHYSCQDTYNGESPLFRELRAINEHKIKTHSILIDDISDYDIDEVKRVLSNYHMFQVLENILICLP